MKQPYNKGKGAAYAWLVAHKDYDGKGCLMWPFAINREHGYCPFGHLGKLHNGHRVMCEMVNGPPPTPRHQAAHSCGNGFDGCLHPKHLSWKTNSENQLDRRIHGTFPEVRNRITPDKVEQIRALRGVETQDNIAKKFGIKIGVVEYWQRHSHKPKRLPKV